MGTAKKRTVQQAGQLVSARADPGAQAHLGVQAVASLLVRGTTQTAVVLSAGMGSSQRKPTHNQPSSKQRKTEPETLLRDHAAAEMLGVLRTTLVGATMVDIGHENRDKASRLRNKFNGWIRQDHPDCNLQHIVREVRKNDELKVELVVTPIDGAGALARGASGSVSVAAAGGPGCFAPCDDKAHQSYLAIAVPKIALLPKVSAYLKEITNDQQGKPGSELLGNFSHLECIVELLLRERGIPPTVAITMKGMADQVRINAWHRRRVLEGSVVAAGLAAYLEKVDCGLLLTRRAQLTQVAIACRGLGGQLVAFPVEKIKDRGKPGLRVQSGDLIREKALVPGDNALLCVTSISEVCLVDRVRFDLKGTVNTDTILVSLATGRVTRQTDSFSLATANARDPDGSEAKLRQRIDALWKP